MSRPVQNIEEYLANIPEVTLAYVFGSVAADTAGRESDVDIAVQVAESFDAQSRAALVEAIALRTGRPVDLVDLRRVGEPLLGEILRHGIRVKGDRGQHAELVRRHVFDTEDFLPTVRRLLAERRQKCALIVERKLESSAAVSSG